MSPLYPGTILSAFSESTIKTVLNQSKETRVRIRLRSATSGGNEMRGFGGIFPMVPEGDVEGIKRSSELFEDRLELAQGDCAGGC